MRARGFTIVEMLTVVALLAVLAAVLLPVMTRSGKLARSTQCASNLHQLAVGISIAQQRNKALKYDPVAWPDVPMNVMPTAGVYKCPEDKSPINYNPVGYQLLSDYGNIFANFEDGPLCRVVPHGTYTEYRFDDGYYKDYDDVVIYVTSTTPRVATSMGTSYHGDVNHKLSLCYRGAVVPGWEDFRNVPQGKSFTMAAANSSSYGMNANLSASAAPPPGRIVLLDYTQALADFGEDVSPALRSAGRHLGRLNALYADNSVQSAWPTEIDPWTNPEAWK